MDEVAHVGFAYVAFYNQPWLLPALFFAVVPDLLVAPFVFLHALEAKKIPAWKELAAAVRGPYLYAHSFLLLAAASAVAVVAFPPLVLPLLLGWGLHLLLDLFSHKGSLLGGRQPFYPFTNVEVNGLFHWRSIKGLAAVYSVLAALFASRLVYKFF